MANTLTNIVFSKFGLVVIAVIFIWFFGGMDIVLNNPMLIVFGILALVVMSFVGGKK